MERIKVDGSRRRHVRVGIVCIVSTIGCSIPRLLPADEPPQSLLEAHAQYEKDIEQIENDALAKLDEWIGKYSDEGNLKKVLELRKQKMRLLEERAWPDSALFRSMREKIRSARTRARRALVHSYEQSIAELTKDRRYDDAVALGEELEELVKIQEECDEPRPKPAEKKKILDADEDSDLANPPIDAKPSPKSKNRPRTNVPSKPPKAGEIDIARTLSAAAAESPLANPLATSEDQEAALTKIVKDFYDRTPPSAWTAKQCEEFTAWFSTVAVKLNPRSCSLPVIAPTGNDGSWTTTGGSEGLSGGDDTTREFAYTRPCTQWLVSSPSIADFTNRSLYLQRKVFWQVIDQAVTTDDIKLWLKSIGCRDVPETRKALDTVLKGGSRSSAVAKVRAEIGN